MPKNVYPIMIAALLGSFILFLVWSGFQASTHGTQVTDRDYYSKGLRYNSTEIEKRAAISLGWRLTTVLSDGLIQFTLTDKKELPVAAAKGLLSLYSRPDSDLMNLPMAETSAGHYQVQLPQHLKGEVTVRVEFERAGARINRQLLINL